MLKTKTDITKKEMVKSLLDYIFLDTDPEFHKSYAQGVLEFLVDTVFTGKFDEKDYYDRFIREETMNNRMSEEVKKEAKREFEEALEIDGELRQFWINYQHWFKQDKRKFLRTLVDDIQIYLEDTKED